MNTDFVKSIFFPSHVEKYDERTVTEIKRDAQWAGKHVKRDIGQKFVIQRSVELATSVGKQDLDTVQKLIFISNTVLTNDETFTDLMESLGWTDEKTKQLNVLLAKIKVFKKRNKTIDFDISLLEEIQNISKICFGINNPSIVINRLNELAITKTYIKEKTKAKKY